MSGDGFSWGRLAQDLGLEKDARAKQIERSDAILADCNAVQRSLILDPGLFKSGLCPRRAGKSHGATAYALYLGERYPGSRVLIIGLTLKAAKENYWQNAPGGVQAFNTRYGLGLDINYADVSWRHSNGSVGFLAGAETAADLERLRGSKVETDLVVIDECKSFAPERLRELILDVLLPGTMTRNGTICQVGTPGSIPLGPFYEATCLNSVDIGDRPTCIPYADRTNPKYAGLLATNEDGEITPRWSAHHWTLQDNTAKPNQWKRALLNKKMNGWDDNHPSWRREYLGQWVEDAAELVYAYSGLRSSGKVTWVPSESAEAPHGLDPALGPWHLLLGLDFGYEDDFAMVVAAYGEHCQAIYHLWDWKSPHLTLDDMQQEITKVERRFGEFEAIVADAGGLGKVLVETFSARGIPVIRADKHEKFDFIELLNADFHSGRLKIIPETELHFELCGLQWDLSKHSKEILARTGRLKESPNCPNHLCDALLYLWRYSYHTIATPRESPPPPKYSPDWWRIKMEREKRQVEERGTLDAKKPAKFGHVDHFVTRARFN